MTSVSAFLRKQGYGKLQDSRSSRCLSRQTDSGCLRKQWRCDCTPRGQPRNGLTYSIQNTRSRRITITCAADMRARHVTARTLRSESNNRGSNPREHLFYFLWCVTCTNLTSIDAPNRSRDDNMTTSRPTWFQACYKCETRSLIRSCLQFVPAWFCKSWTNAHFAYAGLFLLSDLFANRRFRASGLRLPVADVTIWVLNICVCWPKSILEDFRKRHLWDSSPRGETPSA